MTIEKLHRVLHQSTTWLFDPQKGIFPKITQHKPSDADLKAQAPAAAAHDNRIWALHMLLYRFKHPGKTSLP